MHENRRKLILIIAVISYAILIIWTNHRKFQRLHTNNGGTVSINNLSTTSDIYSIIDSPVTAFTISNDGTVLAYDACGLQYKNNYGWRPDELPCKINYLTIQVRDLDEMSQMQLRESKNNSNK